MKIIVFDTETTGIPSTSEELINQPHICQFAGFLFECDTSTGKFTKIKTYEQLIKPPVPISSEASSIHGITEEMLADKPVMSEVIDEILALFNQADIAVAHNLSFDQRLIEFELERLNRNKNFLPPQIFDTMKETRELCRLPGRGDGFKSPKLQELYKFLFGKNFQNAHNALYDVVATAICLKELYERKVFVPEEKPQSSLF